jgi:hypothetical protein
MVVRLGRPPFRSGTAVCWRAALARAHVTTSAVTRSRHVGLGRRRETSLADIDANHTNRSRSAIARHGVRPLPGAPP